MQALIEIIYIWHDNALVEDDREVIRPECWRIEDGRVLLQCGPPLETVPGSGIADLTELMNRKPPKFVLVPIEEARSLEVFHEQAAQIIRRNVNLHACLMQWVYGHVSLVEALRHVCLQCAARMDALERSHGIKPSVDICFDGDDSIASWLGKAGAMALADLDSMGRACEKQRVADFLAQPWAPLAIEAHAQVLAGFISQGRAVADDSVPHEMLIQGRDVAEAMTVAGEPLATEFKDPQ